ncbi:S-layer homology domain-containing protein [Butyricicoccus sp. AM05-1]|uniref:S-layer homology domain-containing protein n=1 Tax=Butyricicoccus sp. AM05-1 TaxID=2292004 RepID=UPI0013149B12|nr:S-layer homology domain-containing protein [Butyricicoccus sp. AM05-1]
MLKKNMRKRLLAGALATIMALTMCPTWALADDEGITTLPAPEDQMPVVDSTPAEDTIQTPDAGTQGQPEAQDPAQAPSGGTDIEETGNNSNSNENDSQNNDAVSNSPTNTISVQEIQSDRARYRTKAAKYFVLLPKRGTPENNDDQGQANYLPSSDDTAAGITGSDGGVKGLNAGTGYKGFVTAEGMAALAQTSDKSITDIEHGVDEAYLEKPKDLGFFTPGNWNDDGTYAKYTNTDETTRKSLLDTTNFTFHPNRVTIVWYTIKDQSWGYGWGRVEDIHVDGYLKGIPVNVTYYPNYTTNGISGKNEDPIVDNETSGNTYTIRGSNTFEAPEGYSFGGWYTEAACTNEFSDTTTVLMSDLYLYAKWIPNPYTVTWKNEGTTLGTEKVAYNHKPTQSYTPTKEADNDYTYTFKGWAVNGDTSNIVESTDIAVTADVTYVAVFDKTERKYTVTWKNEGTTLGTEKVVYNHKPTQSYTPTKEADNAYTYTFKGWAVNGNTSNIVESTDIAVTADVTYVAVFDKTERKYTVTWKNEGTTLGTEKVAYNHKPTQSYTPTKEADNAYTYTFKGWAVNGDTSNIVESTDIAVTADVTYVAVFDKTERKYTVTWKNEETILGTEKVAYNHKPTQSYTPTKEADNAYTYTFKGWAVNGDTNNIVESTDIAVTADVTYVAVFEKTARQKNYNYTINKHFYNEKDVEVNVVNGVATSAVENTEIKDLYTANKQETFKNQTYVYVPGLTKVTDNLEKLTKDVTIDLYYYLDVKGGEKPDETGNGTPDAWEYRLAFKVVNGEWNNGGSADIVVYVPFKDYKTGKTLKEVVVPITRIPVVGDKPNSGYRAGSWDTTPVGNAKVEKDTVFTYTYAKKSSSGGGGGGGSRKPTVTIPDDVPTGLNGDDHYAYIVGYPDSTVRPQNGITRAEVATIFFRLLTDETRNANSTKSNSYSDVAAGAWYNHAVSTLSAMGIVKGDSHGKFNPNAPITRAEFAAIAARFDDKANTTAVDFSDIASHWAKNEISAAANNGWINGYTDGTFRPNNKITRAEAMTLVNRVLKRLPETAEDLHNDMIKWSDNSDTSAWYYLAVQEATNSHYYDLKENKHEKWSKLRETRDWTELEK